MARLPWNQTGRPDPSPPSRREFIGRLAAAGILASVSRWPQSAGAQPVPPVHGPHGSSGGPSGGAASDLVIDATEVRIDGRPGRAVTVNGSLPGPLLRFKEGDEVELRVSNRLHERASIHWHGVLVPAEMDGVPGVSFKGIDPGETFVYRFRFRQYGTYWYHSHSAMQEQQGLYGALVVDPRAPEPFRYDREHVVILSDWTFEDPHGLFAKLKKRSNFSNLQRRTAGDFFREAGERGLRRTWSDWAQWARMRMDPTDIADLTGAHFTYLLNGRAPGESWTGLARAGERVRLRFINAAATTHFDARIPGLRMTVVQADGQHVRPVEVEEFRMGAAETLDVIVQPAEDRPYAIFAETTDRSGYAIGALAPREGLPVELPARRRRPVRTMADMGMSAADPAGVMNGRAGKNTGAGPQDPGMGGMDMGAGGPQAHGSGHAAAAAPAAAMPAQAGHAEGHGAPGAVEAASETSAPATATHAGHGTAAKDSAGTAHGAAGAGAHGTMDMRNPFGPGNSMVAMNPVSRAHEPGTGLGDDGRRVLVYRDLVALDERSMPEPGREIILNVTGNMERFMWGFDGKKFSEAEPIRLRLGERVRITFINQTMMEHPLHLHGMFMELENGADGLPPLKHTVTVKPGEKTSVLVTADAPGNWAFHCHLLYHMEAGMFRVFTVS